MAQRQLGWTGMLALALMSARPVAGQQVAAGETGNNDSAIGAELLTKPVTIALPAMSRSAAIDSLAARMHVMIQYQVQIFDGYREMVSVNAKRKPLGEVIEEILRGTALHVVPDGVALAIVRGGSARTAADSTGEIVGQVVDSATNHALNGATIRIEGTKRNALSDKDGRFVLRDVPVGEHAVTIRLFGYRPARRLATVSASERATIRAVLVPTPNVLTGVVTTAAGVQERRAIGNDITVINADSVMRTAPITSVTDLLENRVPGLIVERTSGVPGAPSRLRLRGIGGAVLVGSQTVSNDPIVVVDGVRVYAKSSTPRDQNLAPAGQVSTASVTPQASFPPPSPLDQIDPNSIETIQVFKGPSATSQWGADAANGVIVITTKRGRAGPTLMSVALSAGTERMPGVYAEPGYYQWGTALTSSGPVFGCNPFDTLNPCAFVDSVLRFQALNVPRLSSFGVGNNQDASVSVSGGSATLQYALTGTSTNKLGYYKMPDFYQDMYRKRYNESPSHALQQPDSYREWGENVTLSAIPREGVRLTLGSSMYNSHQQMTMANQGLAALASTYVDTAYLSQDYTWNNALAIYLLRGVNETVTSTTSGTADWTGWRFAQVQANAGVSTQDRTNRQTIPYGFSSGPPDDTNGFYSIGRGHAQTRTLNVGGTVLPGHRVDVATGVNVVTTTTDDFSAQQDTLLPGVSVPTRLYNTYQSSYSTTTAGWYVEPHLNMHSRFFATPGLRFDGGNALSGRGQSGGRLTGGLLALFPKLNFSWIAIDRGEDAPVGGVVTTLRPRMAFGIAGVQPDPGQNLRTYAPENQLNGPNYPGLGLSTVGNSLLHPERTREVEGGFDLDLWRHRIQLEATEYYKLRIDAILPITLPPSLGGYSYYVNAGRVRNTGTEITLDAQILNGEMLRWSISTSLSTTQNTILSVSGDIPTTARVAGSRLVAGYPLGGRWARPILGYSDPDGDGRITIDNVSIGDSVVYLGTSIPRYQLPLSTVISLWHGLVSVNATLSYVNGITQFNLGNIQQLTNLYLNPSATLAEQAVAVAAAACNAGGINDYELECNGVNGTPYGLLQTVNTLRFSDLSIGYNVPSSWTRHARVPHMTVALRGRNLGLWTNYRGKDPDVNGSLGSELLSDNGQTPLPRQWSLRVTMGN